MHPTVSKLEDLIRASHRRIFSVTPPEGGWERIHADLNRPGPGRPPRSLFGWGFGSGLLAGGLAVYLLLSLHSGTPPAPSTAALPCPDRPAWTAASPAAVPPATDRSTGELLTTPLVSPDPTFELVPVDQTAVAVTDLQPRTERTAEPKTPLGVASPLPAPYSDSMPPAVTSRGRARTLSRLAELPMVTIASVATALPEDKYVFRRVPQEVPIRSRWEVGGSVLVLPARQRYYGYALYGEPLRPGQPGRGNPSVSGPDTLYQGEITGLTEPTRLFHFKSVYLEVGHQFSSGIRLSGGLLGIASGSKNYGNLDPVVDELRSSEVATHYITSSERRLIGTLAFQYTFFRRRRFRLSAGLGIITFLGTRNTETSFIAVGDGYPSGSQSSIQSNNVPFFRTRPLPSLQLQYQLGRHLSLTGDLAPGLGIGLRYGIEAGEE